MPKYAKRWLWSWAIAGVVAPFALLAVAYFVPRPPETGIFDPPPVLTVAQQRLQTASAVVFPGQFVAGLLSLVAMDSGEDSQFVGVIILIVAVAINVAIYAGVGFLLLTLIEACRSTTGRRSFLE
jgi:multidrug efflux pump subunit AcrA (membrane-fusion protein)